MRKQTKLVAVMSAAALLAIGASMTSFAASKWVQEGEDWVYLNGDGERECNVWRRSGNDYYYLGEDGVMVTNALIEDDTADGVYYVDETGKKVMNAWKSVDNEEQIQVGDQTEDNIPTVLYYYFGSSGKAYSAPNGEAKKVREINGQYYMFDEEGHMLSGWQETVNSKGGTDLYYLGSEVEGWARKGWQYLEPSDYMTNGEYDELEWFYFGTSGKASKDKSEYIGSRYYHFNSDGVMDDDWYKNTSTAPTAASGAMAFATLNGSMTNGWVYSGDADVDPEYRYDNDDMYWYYLITVRGENKVARSVPYNYAVDPVMGGHDATGPVRAKVIKNKTYIFDNDGKMLKGFVLIADNSNDPSPTDYDTTKNPLNVSSMTTMAHLDSDHIVTKFAGANDPFNPYNGKGEAGRSLLSGLYYFNEASGSVQGQMMTGRTAITKDGDTIYYYFSKNKTWPGYAYTDAIQDGYLYGSDGKCIVAEGGNNYDVHQLQAKTINWGKKDSTTQSGYVELPAGKSVIVGRTGKIRIGSVTIDGVKYTTDNTGIIDDTKTKYPD